MDDRDVKPENVAMEHTAFTFDGCQHTTMAIVCGDCGAAWVRAASAHPDEAAAVLTLMQIASRDTDAVSMFSFGESVHTAEASVVVLRGPELVARFRDWAEAEGALTRGKPVDGYVDAAEPAANGGGCAYQCKHCPVCEIAGLRQRIAELTAERDIARKTLDEADSAYNHLERDMARQREQTQIARAQCARAQSDRDATWSALRMAVTGDPSAAGPISQALAEVQTERDNLKLSVTSLAGQLDVERQWWPFAESEVSRGWSVFPGEEEPATPIAVFSDEQEASAYATWRQALEIAKPEDDRHPAWEHVNVLPADFRLRYWNSYDPAPVKHVPVEANEIVKAASELPCEWVSQWAAYQRGEVEDAHHPAEGALLCFTECPSCQLRVRAIKVLGHTHQEPQP
jgi:hypothetical protein